MPRQGQPLARLTSGRVAPGDGAGARHLGTEPDSPPSQAQARDRGHPCQLGCCDVPLAVHSALSLTLALPADRETRCQRAAGR
ncbi:hypothetical protein SKAU_G00139610 [Synaphobranchus kaupii]|uniref:Uncharacterized protein n=1 Tax=Synaphobranchus kaupii TaxID=118154 RepID=A0A9Q1FSV7_SYNKA|nr:hypothetical protein SKAU_G00139610 [Synaphobranchus kaupii]